MQRTHRDCACALSTACGALSAAVSHDDIDAIIETFGHQVVLNGRRAWKTSETGSPVKALTHAMSPSSRHKDTLMVPLHIAGTPTGCIHVALSHACKHISQQKLD